MSKQAFEKKLEALDQLSAKELRKALADKNNFYVGKVARRAAALEATELTDALIAAFERLLEGGAEADPKCWGKTGLLTALYDLGHRDPAIYQRAFRCVQWENVWGGKEDSATELRAQAALALVDCDLDPIQLLRALLPGLSDKASSVRIETIRALARLGRWEAELLIRQKALTGDAHPEVLGEAYSAILDLDQQGAVAFVVEMLDRDDEPTQLEAAASLAQSRHQEAFDAIVGFWDRILTEEMRRTIVIALGGSPLEAAREFLLNLLKQDEIETAIWAVTALGASRHREGLRAMIAEIVDQRRDRRLAQAFREEFD